MKTNATLFFLLLFISLQTLFSQATRTITNDDLATGQYTWSSDTVYYLNGPVALEAGGELTIEAGTVIRGIQYEDNSPLLAGSSLVIANGARLIAEGTATEPIIFTSEYDDLAAPAAPDELDNQTAGRWGGIFILGNAPVTLFHAFRKFDHSITGELFYGGEDPNHDSGRLSYVSIRFAGQHFTSPYPPAGLNLLGVGDQTLIDHVEVFNSLKDGIIFNGGTVNATHLVAAHSLRREFYITNGYRGKGQFWLGINSGLTSFIGHPMIGIEGDFYFNDEEYSSPNLANITLLNTHWLSGETDVKEGVYFDKRAAGSIRNSVFTNLKPWNLTIKKSLEDAGLDAYTNYQNGEIELSGNVFNMEGTTFSWEQLISVIDDSHDPVTPYLNLQQITENNLISNELLLSGSCLLASDCMDLRPRVNSSILTGGTPINEPGFINVPYQGAFGPDGYWIANWTATAGPANLQSVSGYVRFNGLFDCDENSDAGAAPGTILAFDDGQFVRYAVADSTGFYSSFLPTGDVTVTITPPSTNTWGTCNSPTTFTVNEGEQLTQDHYVTALKECPELYVDISTPFLRRCFESTYFVTYGNRGSATTNGTEIEVVLDTSLTYLSSSEILVAQFGDTLIFAVDDLEPFDQRRFTITVEVSCESDLGQEHCTEATITETAGCTPFVGAQLIVSSYCDGDSIHFSIKNIGDQSPPNPVGYIVIEDEIMLLEGVTNPAPGETEVLTFEALDATFHLATESFAVDGGELSPQSLSTLSCSDEPNTSLAAFSVTDSPAFARDCQVNIGAFDPNDKYGYPLGLTEDHLVPVDPSFTYRIRFQNTGTDTAFNIVVLDTISELLDITTLRMGTTSHPMKWTLEDRTLKVSYPNIMLPDSFVNEPLSNGFFTYRIAAVPDLEIGSTIYNAAGIYFDFNDPIITNETYHTISRFFAPTAVFDRPNNPMGKVTVAPQPATRSVRISPVDFPATNGSLALFDPYGRLVREVSFTATGAVGTGINLDVVELTTGIYYFRILTPNGRSWSAGKVLVGE